MPELLYSAAADGYFESYDYGQSWKNQLQLCLSIMVMSGLAVDVDNPQTVIVYAFQWTWQAHFIIC